ncbi:MAG: GNAT family N-acetyltransferase [Bacteroidia bacterium]|nr:GNAT family N-acetyltransferase [Bacteroidia bacterium]
MNFTFSLANESDLESVHSLIRNCANALLASGLKQWDATYPDKNILLNDIKNKTLHCCKLNDEIAAVVVANRIQDKEYEAVNWKDKSNNFAVIHRLAVNPKMQRMGIGRKLMKHIEEYAKSEKINSIRLDTFSLNPASIQFYKDLDYTELEHIHLPYQPELFICFEKIID